MEKKIKVGVIGVGSIAEMHIAGYKADPRVELAALCNFASVPTLFRMSSLDLVLHSCPSYQC